jgi:tRNA pseudouridine65 synthase
MSLNVSDIVPEIPLGKGVTVLAVHAEGLVALEKPCGVLSHPNNASDEKRSLLHAAWSKDRERYIWKVGDTSYRFFLLHRLDSATSGVILGCVNPNMARELKDQFSKRKVSKSYTAVVAGRANPSEKVWRDLLVKKQIGSGVRMNTGGRGGSPAETRVSMLECKQGIPKLSLLKLNPLTGRTHQLRVQAAKRGLPIVGDGTYGNFKFNREIAKSTGENRLFLHAGSIKISWDWLGRPQHFHAESALPEAFRQLMEIKKI